METMNRRQKADEFLKFIRDLAVENPWMASFHFDYIYDELIYMDTPRELRRDDEVAPFFDKWIQRFKERQDTEVKVEEDWSYFCQFNRGDALSFPDHIKIYIPLDLQHMERGVNEIFDFLSENNMVHRSKVGKGLRFDTIVVRLTNRKDADKFMKFLKKNSYIQEGLMAPNPFAFNRDGIAMAVDGHLSYNSTLCKYISLYMSTRKEENRLAEVGIDDFYNFVREYYNRAFFSKDGLSQVAKDLRAKIYTDNDMVNYQNVTSLILKAGDPSFSYEDYLEHFRKCTDKNELKKQVGSIRAIKSRKTLSPEEKLETKNLLLNLITNLEYNYGTEHMIREISDYVKLGKIPYDFSSVNLPDNFRENLCAVLKEKNISIGVYISVLRADRNPSLDPDAVVESLVHEILDVMVPKYGFEEALDRINEYLIDGNPAILTRTNNLRQHIIDSNFLVDVKNFLLENNINLRSYLEQKNVEDISISCLNKALKALYHKQEELNREGISFLSGEEAVQYALVRLIEKGSFEGFKDVPDNLTELMRHCSRDTILSFITESMHHPIPEQSLTHKIALTLSREYASMILQPGELEKGKSY